MATPASISSAQRAPESYSAHATALSMKTSPVVTNPSERTGANIHFYNKGDPFFEFTNFFLRPIHLDGKDWPSSEHYFQGSKFVHTAEIRERIRLLKSPRAAFTTARLNDTHKRADWEHVRDDVMRRALRAKFTQHDDLRALLLASGKAKLSEHTQQDTYWGDGGDGSGKNMYVKKHHLQNTTCNTA
eukprot:TRINITY_DN7148_c0_g1_i3.p1 TRINITY_DN7148_c0_g1~~TRINITY_DN7148_c0_g1_i3.p1  ORF type:complete len:187 (+),score=25.50 TRINITY_DN7148_c0_g1_i3:81-641(+)